MAIRQFSVTLQSQKVRDIRTRLKLGVVEMALAMGRGSSWVSRLENPDGPSGRRTELTREEKWAIADFAAGKGDFAKVGSELIYSFLDGAFDTWDVTLVPRLAPRGDGGARLDSTAEGSDIPGYLRAVG